MTKRIFWISLICLAVASIFMLTLQGQEGTVAISVSVQQWLMLVVQRLNGDESWRISVHDVRRLAHLVEYFVLGLVVCVGLNRIDGDVRRSAMMTPALCFVISLADQFIKWMLPTRHFDVFDLVLDAAGYGTAIVIVTIILRLYCRFHGDGEV